MIIKFCNFQTFDKHSFVDIADQWAEEAFEQLAYRTLSCYTAPLKTVKEYFNDCYIEDINHKQIKDYFDFLVQKGFSKKTIQNYRIVLCLIFKSAVLKDICPHNTAADVPIPKGLKSSRRVLPSLVDIEKIKSNVNAEFGLFYFLILYTGIRRGEALALAYEDIDFNNNTIKIEKSVYHKHNRPVLKSPKTESGIRTIPLLDPLKKVLDQTKKGIIFSDEKGNYLTRYQVESGISNYRELTGIECTPHQLRHEFATILHEADIDDKEIQELLGHSDISTTKNIYMHITPRQFRATAEKLNKYLS